MTVHISETLPTFPIYTTVQGNPKSPAASQGNKLMADKPVNMKAAQRSTNWQNKPQHWPLFALFFAFELLPAASSAWIWYQRFMEMQHPDTGSLAALIGNGTWLFLVCWVCIIQHCPSVHGKWLTKPGWQCETSHSFTRTSHPCSHRNSFYFLSQMAFSRWQLHLQSAWTLSLHKALSSQQVLLGAPQLCELFCPSCSKLPQDLPVPCELQACWPLSKHKGTRLQKEDAYLKEKQSWVSRCWIYDCPFPAAWSWAVRGDTSQEKGEDN